MTPLLFKAIVWNFHRSFYTPWKFVCYAKQFSMWCPRGSRTLRKRRAEFFTNLRTFVTHTLCFFKLFNNPVHSVSCWCNTKRKPSTMSLHSNTRSTKKEEVLITNVFWSVACDTSLLLSSVLPMAINKFFRMCRTVCENFKQLFLIIKKLYEF
jgi:hypothetical protein